MPFTRRRPGRKADLASRPLTSSGLPLPENLRIRPETAPDFDAIDRLQLAAFDDPQIPPLIAAIRASSNYLPDLALVAELADRPQLAVGQIMVSALELVTDGGERVRILCLSPLGVDPAFQNRGIGAALTMAAIGGADRREEPLMIVQGHPEYYPRFGFVRGRTIGILPPEHLGAIDRAWMARPGPHWTSNLRGRVEYPDYFAELD
jgi:putative acetyltransferase